MKPIQVFGRVRFLFYSPSACHDPVLPLRKKGGRWVQSAAHQPSLLSPARFRLLNEEHDLSTSSDWNNPAWEKLWLYHLHYFDDLNAAGAEERGDWQRELLLRWINENPMGQGNGWEPYPLSRRIVNWVKWELAGNMLPGDFSVSLALQARFLRKRLEWHILGNHLLANAKALIFAGLFFDGEEADGWLKKGASIWSGQLTEQILTDGGHFERSPMYHAQVLEDVLDTVNVLRTFPVKAFSGRGQLIEQCIDTAGKMLGWLQVMRHPDGEIALLNDSAFGDAAAPSTLFDYATRLGIGVRSSVPLTVPFSFTHLCDTGYIRVDDGDLVAFLDVAPIGPDYLPGHAHADTLSFELSLGHQRVIVDSGVSRYGEGNERLRQRGTAAHNTVMIDGENSSEVWGGFRVARRAYPFDLKVSEKERLISCAHNGYRRLPGKPVHWREWCFTKSTLTIRDRIDGKFSEAVGRFHFHPSVTIERTDSNRFSIRLPDGALISCDVQKGIGRLVLSTYHPEFGINHQNHCLEVQFHGTDSLISFIGHK